MLPMALANDAVIRDGACIGDPTEGALVVLAAKGGIDVDDTRKAYPRLAEVPFDAEYKLMATFHEMDDGGRKVVRCFVKGAPDVLLSRSSQCRALNSRIVIEQAKGVRAERASLDMEQAFARLRSYARNNNLRLADVANDVISGALAAERLHPTPTANQSLAHGNPRAVNLNIMVLLEIGNIAMACPRRSRPARAAPEVWARRREFLRPAADHSRPTSRRVALGPPGHGMTLPT
jgi:hypothetical protein